MRRGSTSQILKLLPLYFKHSVTFVGEQVTQHWQDFWANQSGIFMLKSPTIKPTDDIKSLLALKSPAIRPVEEIISSAERLDIFRDYDSFKIQNNSKYDFKCCTLLSVLKGRDATNALEQEDSLLNKGLNNSFLNYNSCFFF